MTTLEMMNIAEISNKVFTDCDTTNFELFYSKEKGFFNSEGEPYLAYHFLQLNSILDIDSWREVKRQPKAMTKKEIEKELGYPIIIYEDEENG